MGDHFWFGSIFITKKNNQTEFFLKKTKTISNRPVSVRFGFFGQNRFGWVFFRFGSVWFFQFQAYKTETEPNQLVFSKF
jgi:hypothetical protein